jgi:predicted dehydrogenase
VTDLRLGLVGCGRIAERGYVPALRRARGVRLAAVADQLVTRCEQLAPGVPAFTSAAELLAEASVDGLVLATPAAAHVRDAALAAAAGVRVLVEKPPAPTAGEAEELVRLEPAPFVGFNRRFEPALQKLRADIGAAELARVELRLRLQRREDAWPSTDPVTLDLGPHLVDLALWLTGASDAARVTGTADGAHLALELELPDERGSASIECTLGRTYREVVEARDVGTFARGGLRSRLRRGESPLVESLALQLEAFATAVIQGRETGLGTAAEGVRVMRILERVTS